MKPLLIVQADDAGVHPAIDRGILRGVDEGPVTSVGVVVAGETASSFARSLTERPEVGVGLHFALTGVPALASTRLGEPGQPMPSTWRGLARRLATGAVTRDDIWVELTAQIQRAEAFGLAIDHLGAHNHIHLLPGIADIFARLASVFQLPRRVRVSRTPGLEFLRDRRAVALRAASSFARRTAWRDFKTPDRVVGIADLGGVHDLSRVAGAVSPRFRSIELIVHPGDQPLSSEPPLPPWDFDWVGELEALLSTPWRTILAASYTLGTYLDL